MALKTKILNSKISRRVFLTLLMGSLLPVLLFAFLAYYQIINYIENQTIASLRHSAKSISLNIADRLKIIENEMELIILMMNNPAFVYPSGLDINYRKRLSERFKSVTLFLSPSQSSPLFNQSENKTLKLSSDEIKHLSDGSALLAERSGPQSKPSIFMIRLLDANEESKNFIVGELNINYLWEVDGLINLPLDTELCVLNSVQDPLFISKPEIIKSHGYLKAKNQLSLSTSGEIEFNSDGHQYVSGYTKLFLKPKYYIRNWSILLIKSKFDLNRPFTNLRYSLPIFLILLFIAVIWLSLFNIRKNLVPIKALKESASRFANKDFHHKIIINSDDEFEELAKAFNMAGDHLAFSYQENRKINNELLKAQNDLEEKVKKRTAELAKAKGVALKASKSKSEFLANMSHELRTPLNHIIGFTELILTKNFGDLNEIQEEYLNDVHGSSYHLLSLVNDILDISKVEAGKLELKATDFNPSNLIDNSLILVKEKALKHSIQIANHVNSIPETITADERMLKQILYNLLSNAVKFTPDGGKVTVRASQYKFAQNNGRSENKTTRSGIQIGVSDTGIGVHPDDSKRIFNTFEQVENLNTRKFQGTGLGLALTKKLVELHGGKIWVESEGEGKGATFIFCIPV